MNILESLNINETDLLSFLETLPFYAEKTDTKIINNEFREDKYCSTFKFKDEDYEICLEQGYIEIGKNKKKKKIPLPYKKDNIIKDMIVDLKKEGIVDSDNIEKDEVPDFIYLIKLTGIYHNYSLSEYSIMNSLIRLENTKASVRRKCLNQWIELPWLLNVPFRTIKNNQYRQLDIDKEDFSKVSNHSYFYLFL